MMSNLSATNFSDGAAAADVVFDVLFVERPLKTVSILVSVVGSIVTIPLVYGIIWFERGNHFRTLINQVCPL